jgi:hypothetical protein
MFGNSWEAEILAAYKGKLSSMQLFSIRRKVPVLIPDEVIGILN